MFDVNSQTKVITMHQGDTGTVTFTITGYDWSETTAKAVFTLRKKNDPTPIKEVISGNLASSGVFTVTLENGDTDQVTPGTYEYDVVLVVTPTTTDGHITNGTVVRTLIDPTPFIIKRRVNDV